MYYMVISLRRQLTVTVAVLLKVAVLQLRPPELSCYG